MEGEAKGAVETPKEKGTETDAKKQGGGAMDKTAGGEQQEYIKPPC